jgi:hypothetical protein
MGDEGLPVVQFFGGNEAPLQFGAEMPGLSRNSSTAKAIAYK